HGPAPRSERSASAPPVHPRPRPRSCQRDRALREGRGSSIRILPSLDQNFCVFAGETEPAINDNERMWLLQDSRIHPLGLALLLMVSACYKAGETPEIKKPGIFTQSGGNLVEIPGLGTLGTSYGPRLYPEIPDYDIPVVPDVGPIYVNMP